MKVSELIAEISFLFSHLLLFMLVFNQTLKPVALCSSAIRLKAAVGKHNCWVIQLFFIGRWGSFPLQSPAGSPYGLRMFGNAGCVVREPLGISGVAQRTMKTLVWKPFTDVCGVPRFSGKADEGLPRCWVPCVPSFLTSRAPGVAPAASALASRN